MLPHPLYIFMSGDPGGGQRGHWIFYTLTLTNTYTHVHPSIHTYIHTYSYIHMLIHIHTYTFIHTHTPALWWSPAPCGVSPEESQSSAGPKATMLLVI